MEESESVKSSQGNELWTLRLRGAMISNRSLDAGSAEMANATESWSLV